MLNFMKCNHPMPIPPVLSSLYSILNYIINYFLQKEGVTSIIKANISSLPASIRKDITHFPAEGTKSNEPVTPVTPAPKPLFEAQEIDEKNASTIGKSNADSKTPPAKINAVYIKRNATISLVFSGVIT